MRRALFVLSLAACGGPQGPVQSRADVDGDGIPDVRDRCAYVAGIEELDGCAGPPEAPPDAAPDAAPDAPVTPDAASPDAP